MDLVLLAATLVFSSLFLHTDASWVDPDTHKKFRRTEALTKGDDREYELVRELSEQCSRNCGTSCLTFFCQTYDSFRSSLTNLNKTAGHSTMETTRDGLQSTKMIVRTRC